MKQYITIEELKGLSKKAEEKLAIYWHGKRSPPIKEYDDKTKKGIKLHIIEYPPSQYIYKDLPIFSIGQMMEFLDEKNIFLDHFLQLYGMDKKVDKYWEVGYLWFDGKEKRIKREREICDILWEIVKEVLNK